MTSLALSNQVYNIRQAIIEDGEEIFRLMQQAFAGYGFNKSQKSDVKIQKDKQVKNPALEETLAAIYLDIEENIVLIIENGEEIIGSLRLEFIAEQKYYLKRFAILPEYQHQGLGTRLFYVAEEEIKRRQGQYVYLYSSLENEKLIKFYHGLGFCCLKIDNKNGYKRGLWVKRLKD